MGGDPAGQDPPPPAPATQLDARASGGPSVALPVGDRGRVAIALLVATFAAAAASLWADANQLTLVNQVLDGERVSLQELQASDDRVGTTAILYTIAVILSAITFLLWYSRAYRNVIALGVRQPRFGTRWAVAYWFIPIVSLFRPKQVVNDIWRGSDPDLPPGASDWMSRPVAPLIHWWWAAWLLSTVVGNIAVRLTFNTGGLATPDEIKDEATAYVIADIADMIAAVLAILVVRSATARVEERRERAEAGELPPGASPPVSWECVACGFNFASREAATGHVELVHADEFSDATEAVRELRP